MEDNPAVVVIAGPNGAGKSTSAPAILRDTLGINLFVNADEIARGLSGFHPEGAALPAGRIMLARLKELAANRMSFAFETTLAAKSYAAWIADLKKTGYHFHLFFFWLPSPEMAVARVQDRVRKGGHNVPPETIKRRYSAGLFNFFNLYRPLADTWKVFDNSDRDGARLIASKCMDGIESIVDNGAWAKVCAW
jgi:predicted ABC-type ATPase